MTNYSKPRPRTSWASYGRAELRASRRARSTRPAPAVLPKCSRCHAYGVALTDGLCSPCAATQWLPCGWPAGGGGPSC